LAAASAKEKIDPKPISIPHEKLPAAPVEKPGPDIGGHVREAAEARRDAGAAGNLNGKSGAEATMHPPAAADPLLEGRGIQTVNWMDELCKKANFRRLVGGLGLCAGYHDGSEPPIDPKTGEIHYNTESPVRPGGKYHGPTGFGGPTAGDRVPGRNGPASDGETRPDITYKDFNGYTFEIYQTRSERHADGSYTWTIRIVERDPNKRYVGENISDTVGPDYLNGSRTITDVEADGTVVLHPTQSCTNGTCVTPIHVEQSPRGSQPGERGQAGGNFRSSFYCLQDPKNPNCEPPTAGSKIDPANPDGAGTATARPRTEVPRLGKGAVSDPGPADSEIRGVSGGGSKPLDMKDPVRPTPPN
jgi:hypothetical protein